MYIKKITQHKTVPRGIIRIIGGKWRGRKLPVYKIDGLRPTTDRIRETLFNWLIPVIQESRCLDCFAGSGVLAIEALSRYAASATLIELERIVATQLAANLVKLNAQNAQVINTNILSYLQKLDQVYDVVFLDPPFRKNLLEPTAWLLESNGWLTEHSWIYVEAEAEANLTTILPNNWQIHRQKISGQVAYGLYIRNSESIIY